MFTIAFGRSEQAGLEGRVSRKALRLAAVLGILILLSIAVNALTIFADGNLRHPPSAARPSAITENAGRLA